MPFSSFKNIGAVIKQFNLTYREENFIVPAEATPREAFRAEIEFSLREVVVDNSEYAICENFIYPILKEVWKNHKEKLMLWSHRPLNYDEQLSGVPDYIVAQRSPQGKVVFDRPYFLLVEAKEDNFTQGWGQCLAELIAARSLSENPKLTIFGIVSNGEKWEFGKLTLDLFTKNIKKYQLEALDELVAAVSYVFEQCNLQVSNRETNDNT